MPLSPTDRDLALLASRATPDAFLNRLLTFARIGIGWGITVVLGGTLISGDLVGPMQFAENLDAKMLEPIDAQLSAGHEELQPIREQLAENPFVSAVRDTLERHEELLDKAMAAQGDLDEETEREVLAAGEFAALTLGNATVFPPNLTSFNVDMIRIHVTSVDAWWLGRTSQ